MLSYRHGYHAGNHADVLKHTILLQIIDYLALKETPFWVIDTHAGAGGYALQDNFAQKNREYLTGIDKIWRAPELKSIALLRYRNAVSHFNLDCSPASDSAPEYYPGSPQLSHSQLRRQDKLKLFELHSTEAPALKNLLRSGRKQSQVLILNSDGLAGVKALLPPPPRRALVLIDPSYEMDDEYQAVLDCVLDGLKRFANGVFAVWYPVLDKSVSRRLPHLLQSQVSRPWLQVQLHVQHAAKGGMSGSGMFIINPPWTLRETLNDAMPELVALLALDTSAAWSLDTNQSRH